MASVQGAMMPPGQQLSTMDFLLSMLVQIALYVPFLVVYFTLPKRSVPHTGIIRKLVWVLVGLFTVSISAPILDICGFSGWLMKATGCPEHQDVVRTLMDGSWADKALMAFMAVIAAPITEECCFRGFVYNILKHWTTPLLSVVLSAMLFSAVHASLAQTLPLFIFGIVQCLAYEKARSLWLPVTLHMLFNGFNVVAILYFM